MQQSDTVTEQPRPREAPGSAPVNGVTIRHLRDTQEDAEFAANLVVESFRGKYIHNITEPKLPIAKKNSAANHRNQYETFYGRTFVAEYQGSSAGICQLKFKGDKQKSFDDHVSELGCCHAWNYNSFVSNMTTSVKDPLQCYVDHIGVSSNVRGKGIGKLLLDRADYEARARGCTTIFLYVTTDNRAVSLYERQGYRITDTHTCCMHSLFGPPGSVYKMEKTL